MVMAGARGAALGAAITRRINAGGTTARGTAAGSGPRQRAESVRWRANHGVALTLLASLELQLAVRERPRT